MQALDWYGNNLTVWKYVISNSWLLCSAFNNILSNLGYVMLGLLFLLIVLKRDIVHNRALVRNDVNALVRHMHANRCEIPVTHRVIDLVGQFSSLSPPLSSRSVAFQSTLVCFMPWELLWWWRACSVPVTMSAPTTPTFSSVWLYVCLFMVDCLLSSAQFPVKLNGVVFLCRHLIHVHDCWPVYAEALSEKTPRHQCKCIHCLRLPGCCYLLLCAGSGRRTHKHHTTQVAWLMFEKRKHTSLYHDGWVCF